MAAEKYAFSNEELKRILNSLLTERISTSHLSPDEMSAYVETVFMDGHETAAIKYQKFSDHFARCDTCMTEFFLLMDLIKSPEYVVDYEPDLSFLRHRTMVWQLVEGAWNITEIIRIKVDKARLIVQNTMKMVQLVPIPIYPMRSDAGIDNQRGPQEMIIEGPDTNWKIKALLTPTSQDTLHFFFLGVQLNDKLILDGVETIFTHLETGHLLSQHSIKNKGIDFGILNAGEYRFEVKYNKQLFVIHINLEV